MENRKWFKYGKFAMNKDTGCILDIDTNKVLSPSKEYSSCRFWLLSSPDQTEVRKKLEFYFDEKILPLDQLVRLAAEFHFTFIEDVECFVLCD